MFLQKLGKTRKQVPGSELVSSSGEAGISQLEILGRYRKMPNVWTTARETNGLQLLVLAGSEVDTRKPLSSRQFDSSLAAVGITSIRRGLVSRHQASSSYTRYAGPVKLLALA